jgi:hypothetical protein
MDEASGHPVQQPLFEELKRLGYVEGRNVVVERYSGEGRTENYPELARRVVSSMPDLIFIVTGRLTRFLRKQRPPSRLLRLPVIQLLSGSQLA